MPGVTVDSSGTLYGTTEFGGISSFQYCGGGCGTVFKVKSSGKESVLHSFTEPPTDGIMPQAGVIRDSLGALYGTTTLGGPHNAYGNPGEGTVFKIADGKETLLYAFTGGSDGALPAAALLLRKGVFYGTTTFGGDGPCSTVYGAGCGTVFKLKGATETVLYSFNNQSDGGFPASSLIADRAGNLYGTTTLGGDLNCSQTNANPEQGKPALLPVGNPPGCGTVFKISPGGHETVLHTFQGKTDGAWPGELVMDSAGNLHGATVFAGDPKCHCGIVFKVDTAGKFTVLHAFSGPDGSDPEGLIQYKGRLYGTAAFGGPGNYGLVFEVTP
jgi:uncharacterized repeat protein (TIGR03803 family)